jgi:ribosomal protein S18 acetylase RimI-like enzyme
VGADYDALVTARDVTVVVEDGTIVGAIVLRPQPEGLLVENVAVLPAAQGRGIGRQLMAFAEERARELGLAKLRLYTNERMTENLAFYPALGYVEVGRRHEDGFDRVFFEKSLA